MPTTAETKARAQVAARTTKQLILDFEVTDRLPMSPELPMVRRWIMDELESRNPEAYWAWIDSNENSPRRFF